MTDFKGKMRTKEADLDVQVILSSLLKPFTFNRRTFLFIERGNKTFPQKMKTFFDFKYFKILQTFSEEELKAFDLWLKSPWCNTNKNLIKLLDKVKKYHPTYEDKKLTKERIFKQVLPKGKFSDRRMNNLLSEGYLAAERFIIFQNLIKDENLKKDLLTKEFQNRHLEDWFFRDVNKEITRLEDKEIKDWEDHLDLLRLNRRVYHHPNQNPRMQPGGQTIVKMGEQLDLVYLLEKAAIINEKIFRKRLFKNENHDVRLELRDWKLVSQGIKHPVFDFYKMRFEYTEEKMLEKYIRLQNKFLNEYGKLNKKEQNTHLYSLLNDSALLSRKKVFDLSERLPLYKLGLKTGILFSKGKLTYITYYSIISASNTQRDFKFTKDFINNYTDFLEKEYKSDAKNWALAHTAYRKKQFQDALDILLFNDFKHQFFKLAIKLLTTQTYFDFYLKDNSYQDFLFNYFDSFEKWIQREKFSSKIYKEGFLRFVQKSRTLAKYYSEPNFQHEKVQKLLIGEVNVQAIKWLEKQIIKVLQMKNGGHPIIE